MLCVQQPYLFKEGQWRASKGAFSEKDDTFILEDGSSPAITVKAISDGLYSKIADFDSHLEDVKEDWLTNRNVA
jgi:hypothetical protein